jgi:hypothetical protein
MMMNDIAKRIEEIIKAHSTTTKSIAGYHAGQTGYILYERDGLPFVIKQIALLIAEKDAEIERLDREEERAK